MCIRDSLYHALTEIGYTCIHPDGAFYLFLKALEEDDTKFCERAKEEKILMAPGTAFYGPGWVDVYKRQDKMLAEQSCLLKFIEGIL